MEKLEFLKKLPIFFNLKDEEIISVLKFFKYYEESFKKNDFIFEIEKKIDKIGIIIFGEINIIKEDFWGNRNILGKFKSGEIFGEVFALSKRSTPNLSVEASQNCKILFLDLKDFLINNPKNPFEIYKFLNNVFQISLKKNILLMIE